MSGSGEKIDLSALALRTDPAPILTRARESGGLAHTRFPMIGEILLTTSHAGAETVLKDRTGFVSNPATAGLGGSPVPRWLPRRFRLLAKNMVLYDEPDHKRLRRLVDQAFARRGVEAMRPALERQTEALLGAVDPSGFDLVSSLARPLPLGAISDLLGLPEGERGVFETLAAPLSQGLQGFGVIRALWSLGSLINDIESRIAAARAGDEKKVAPDGLIALLTQAEAEAEERRLDADELVAMILTLLVAGHETTTHLISGGAWALLTHPEQKARLTGGETASEDAVEELLRWLTPVTVTKARYAAQDAEIDGAPIRRGQRVSAFLLAANHDPRRWEDPERLDLARKPSGHLAFGAGVHFCLGLQLARLEAQIALARLFERFPKLRLAGDPDWSRRPGLRGLNALRLRAD